MIKLTKKQKEYLRHVIRKKLSYGKGTWMEDIDKEMLIHDIFDELENLPENDDDLKIEQDKLITDETFYNDKGEEEVEVV